MTQKINFWKILKEFLGKDLTTVTLPIYFNEPQSFLQTTARFLEYESLLIQANSLQCKGLQCAYILSAFIIGYGNSVHTTKKPFNPMLGETYDFYNPLTQTWMIMEQVSHHPPITAYYGENEHFICQGWFQIKTRFSMSGFCAEPKEHTLITLKSTKEQFVVNRPIITVHNMIIGEMFVWAEGLATCENLNTGHVAQMYLHPVGFFQKKENKIEGKITDPFGNVLFKIFGKWNQSIFYVKNNDSPVEIVKLNEFPDQFTEQYCFSKFSINLNNLTQQIVSSLPSTDCRLRTDIRAYEYGDLELASAEKN